MKQFQPIDRRSRRVLGRACLLLLALLLTLGALSSCAGNRYYLQIIEQQQERIEAAAKRKSEQEQRERQLAVEKEQRRQLEAQGKTSFMTYYEGLVKRAQDGDQEAARLVNRHRATYEQHLQSITQKNGKEQ